MGYYIDHDFSSRKHQPVQLDEKEIKPDLKVALESVPSGYLAVAEKPGLGQFERWFVFLKGDENDEVLCRYYATVKQYFDTRFYYLSPYYG